MPVTSMDLRNQSNLANYSGLLGALDTSSYLLNDNDEENRKPVRPVQKVTVSPDSSTFLQLHQTNDRFPILLRRETDSAMQSNAPTNEISSSDTQVVTDRATATRHRQSLPPSAMRSSVFLDNFTGLNGILSDSTTAKNTAANRRSLEVKFSGLAEQKRPSLLSVAGRGSINGFGKTTSSYSTNDIPTLKSIHALSPVQNSSALYSPADEITPMLPVIDTLNPPTTQAAATMALPYKGFRYASQQKDTEQNQQQQAGAQSGLQASAPAFGPATSATSQVPAQAPIYNGATALTPYNNNNNNNSAYYGGYGMQLLNNSMNSMSLGGRPSQYPAHPPAYNNNNNNNNGAPSTPRRSEYIQPRVVQPRRTQTSEGKFVEHFLRFTILIIHREHPLRSGTA